MTDKITASEALSTLQQAGKLFRSFEFVEKALVAWAGLEQNEQELRARIARLQSEAAAAEEAFGKIKDQTIEMVSSAEARAREVMREAEQSALTSASRAASDSRAIIEEADKYREAAKQERDDAVRSMREAVARRDAMNAEVRTLEERLKTVRSNIASMLK